MVKIKNKLSISNSYKILLIIIAVSLLVYILLRYNKSTETFATTTPQTQNARIINYEEFSVEMINTDTNQKVIHTPQTNYIIGLGPNMVMTAYNNLVPDITNEVIDRTTQKVIQNRKISDVYTIGKPFDIKIDMAELAKFRDRMTSTDVFIDKNDESFQKIFTNWKSLPNGISIWKQKGYWIAIMIGKYDKSPKSVNFNPPLPPLVKRS